VTAVERAVRRPKWLTPQLVRGVRWGAVICWAAIFAAWMQKNGIPYLRSDLLLWLTPGLLAWSIGRRNVLLVVVDFLPFALVLIVYDHLRGLADSAGMPTWWQPQIDVDRFLFFGAEPTVWLQEHLKDPTPRWWDVPVALCYISFFFLPYLTAAVLWLRSRREFYRWSLRFVTLSFLGYGLFALIPAAPPWAAAQCTAGEVAGHPYNPDCLSQPAVSVRNNLLGTFGTARPGAHPWIERIATRGLEPLHLHFANQIIDEGRNLVDSVAAVPSLHVGGTVLFVLFMWRRVHRWWRPLLVAYPVFMTFSLAYSAEHYVADALAGALVAALVHVVGNRIERRRRVPAADTLEVPLPAVP
jgi:PAP2 superfamily